MSPGRRVARCVTTGSPRILRGARVKNPRAPQDDAAACGMGFAKRAIHPLRGTEADGCGMSVSVQGRWSEARNVARYGFKLGGLNPLDDFHHVFVIGPPSVGKGPPIEALAVS